MTERLIFGAARLLALAGGIALIAMTVLTVVSVTGRGFLWLGLGPVPGAYELVEMGSAFAIFCFLPWCQLQRGHVTVDLFMNAASWRVNRIVDVIANALLTGAAAIILWRLWLAMLDKRQYGETSYILGVPLWIGYSAALLGAALFVIVCAYTVLRSGRELKRGARHGSGEARR